MIGQQVTGVRDIVLRPVSADDEPFLRDVYACSRADELALLPWTSEEQDAFLDMQYRAQREDYQRRFPDARHSVVLVDKDQVGRIWVTSDEDELRLLDITILREHRGKGIGTALLRGLQDEAREAGVPLRHAVLKVNAGAIRLYERLGFVVLVETATHLLMEWPRA